MSSRLDFTSLAHGEVVQYMNEQQMHCREMSAHVIEDSSYKSHKVLCYSN